MMAPDEEARRRHEALTRLFHEAVDATAPARATLLRRVHHDDPVLADELTALLEAHERAAGFLDAPADAVRLRAADSHEPVPRERIGPYRILSVAGAGGMGVVYLAEDTRLGRMVALKSVRPESSADETRRARLRREARAAAALRHPAIATVYALEEIDDQVYVASEFVAGSSLREEMERGPLSPERACAVAVAILGALDAAHRHGIVHRDLKPENVASTPTGDVKVLDFGLAQYEADPAGAERLTRDTAVLGTPAYMSPEQIRGEAVDGRSDLFSWGGLVIEMITGQHPFAAATTAATLARVVEAQVPPLNGHPDARSDLSRLADWAIRCLAKSPDARPRSAGDIMQALAASPPPEGRPSPRQVRPRPAAWWWRFHQIATTVAYLVLLVPLWHSRMDITLWSGRAGFLVALVAAVVSGILRMHLWFARSQYPDQVTAEHRPARMLARAADTVLAVVLAAHGVALAVADAPVAPLLIAAAASVLVSFTIIEPVTTRAMLSDTRH